MIRSKAFMFLLPISGYAFTGRAQIGPPLVTEGPAASLNLILGRPTDHSIALSVLSAADVDARVACGAELGTFSTTTDVHTLKAGVPSESALAALKPNTRYFYRLVGRGLKPLAEGTFHTQRAAGNAFTFALQGDSHPERQGHDHLFARQELDGVVYQSCPNPADPTVQAFNRDAYRSGDILPNSGHLLVTVSAQEVSVDYVRSWLAEDETSERKSGETAFHYTIRTKEFAP